MQKLYVIRHAMVDVVPEVEPHLWQLSEDGRAETERLVAGEDWGDVCAVYHSNEDKARQTAEILAAHVGVPLREKADLRELVADVGFLPADEFKRRVGAFLEGADDPAFEDFDAAQGRFVSCVQEILREAEGRSVAVVTHGRIISAFYASLFGRRVTVEEWKSIQFPDVSVIDVETWRVESGFLAGV